MTDMTPSERAAWMAGRDAAADVPRMWAAILADADPNKSKTLEDIAAAIRLITPPDAAPWQPPPEDERPEGYRCLGLLPNDGWRVVRWNANFECWCYPDNYSVRRSPPTAFHPLPE